MQAQSPSGSIPKLASNISTTTRRDFCARKLAFEIVLDDARRSTFHLSRSRVPEFLRSRNGRSESERRKVSSLDKNVHFSNFYREKSSVVRSPSSHTYLFPYSNVSLNLICELEHQMLRKHQRAEELFHAIANFETAANERTSHTLSFRRFEANFPFAGHYHT